MTQLLSIWVSLIGISGCKDSRGITWNQEGYYAIGLFKEERRKVVRLIQVNCGRTHEMNMRLFASLAAKFIVEYPAKYMRVELFLILTRFQGSKFVQK
jgi:hypothetical protein